MLSYTDNDPAVRPLLVARESEDDEDLSFDSQDTQVPVSEPMLPFTTEEGEEDTETWLAGLQSRPWYLRPSIYWLMPLLVIQGLAVGLMGSPMDQLVIQIICKDYLASSILNATLLLPGDQCKSPEVLAAAALTQSRIQAIKGTITLLTLAKWTSLSDIYGRKLLIRIALISITVSQLLTWFAATGHNPFGYRLLYLDGVLLGLIPGGQIVSPALFAYIADCTLSTSRSVQMGYVLLCFSVGTVVGPYLGGYIVKETGDLTSVIKISIAIYALIAVYLIFVPESLRKENQQSALKATVEHILQNHAGSHTAVKSSFAVKIGGSMKRGLLSIFDPLLIFVPGRVPCSPKVPSKNTLVLLLLSSHLILLACVGEWILFIPMTNLVFKWTAYEDGVYYSFAGFCAFIVFLCIFPSLQFLYKRYSRRFNKVAGSVLLHRQEVECNALPAIFDTEEQRASLSMVASETMAAIEMDAFFIMGGAGALVSAFLIMPIFISVPALYVGSALEAISMVGETSSRSLLTTIIPAHQTGKVMGALSVSNSIASTAANLIYGQIFALTSTTMPWFYFYVSAGFTVASLLVIYTVWRSYHTPSYEQ